MKKSPYSFFKIFWPALIAVLVASMLSYIPVAISMAVFTSKLTTTSSSPSVAPHSVLHVQLNGEIHERSSSKMSVNTLSIDRSFGLTDLLHGLKLAQENKNIQGVFLELDNIRCGYSIAKEIRRALTDFKKSGKFVVAYHCGEFISLTKCYIASCADEVYGFPNSNVSFYGLASELMFLKNTFDKLDIDVEVIRGKNNDFKSAVEPFFLDKMSDSSRLQSQVFLDTIWSEIRKDIASDRKINPNVLNKYADEFAVKNVKDAVNIKLMDGVKYRDEVINILKKKCNIKTQQKLRLIEFEKYASQDFKKSQRKIKNASPNIAVIVAEGDISVDGDGLSSRKICKEIREVREDKNIKAVVLRINSPGGSALASEEIWREISLTDSIKPVVVSMGNLAASGGYYIATPTHRIFAEPTTITGSIGVFGVIPYIGGFLDNKLGLTFDYVQTNKHKLPSPNRKLSAKELKIIQNEVDDIYDDFINKVATGRKLSVSKTQEIARGRVWTGADAVKIGLVDEIGGIKDAVNYAKKIAKLNSEEIVYYPKVKDDAWEEVLEELLNIQQDAQTQHNTLTQEVIRQYRQIEKLDNLVGIQMRLPFLIEF